MRYSVHCPSAPYENSSFVELDDCWGLCLDLSEEYGYAEVRYGNCVMGSYTNGMCHFNKCHTPPTQPIHYCYNSSMGKQTRFLTTLTE